MHMDSGTFHIGVVSKLKVLPSIPNMEGDLLIKTNDSQTSNISGSKMVLTNIQNKK